MSAAKMNNGMEWLASFGPFLCGSAAGAFAGVSQIGPEGGTEKVLYNGEHCDEFEFQWQVKLGENKII